MLDMWCTLTMSSSENKDIIVIVIIISIKYNTCTIVTSSVYIRAKVFTTQSPCFSGLFIVADRMISINEHDKITR